ncbi:hypothetical protein GWK48_06760 [Metallosphaera tengchongensis]|uniref:Uncharacterized protein n=1 Tax=Metallosphaera tengchongensis TaxID=1532350 RepID=A0A6N0NTD2_9CREN|nr:hypothetical protein [Metallosphaera tengchongensis]QKR00114.1 hypothetical protein GWK48_06760 [Metallosphaera tengchongensis]
MEDRKLTDIFQLRFIRLIFSITFVLYFVFYQYVDRILLFQDILLPQGVNIVVDTSPPVPPNQMPYPLWGPFLSITTRYFDWAMTPLSLSISFILSFLVALNVSLYIFLFYSIRMSSKHKLAASLGLLATSLSCSCELFTALIGATVSNIPFLVSITFMNLLGEALTVVAGTILVISSLVIASEIVGAKPFSWMRWKLGIPVAIIFALTLLLLPQGKEFFLARLVISILIGGIVGYVLKKAGKIGNPGKYSFFVSAVIVSILFVMFEYFNSLEAISLSILSGFLGYLGYINLKPWSRLGLLHIIGWSLIMPGPISLVLGSPIPFFSLTGGKAILFWITAWIFGTPIAWLAGVQYLQYIRDNLATYSSSLRLPPTRYTDYGYLKWLVLGGLAVFSQIAFFSTHSRYFLDYNGYDLLFLETMTLSSTFLMSAGLVAIGYGVYLAIKRRYGFPVISKKHFLLASILYGIVEMLVTKMMIIAPNGYPYPPVLVLGYGEPMYAPAVTIYVPGIIGFYLYPVSVLALVSSSALSGYIWALIYNQKRKKLGSLTAFSLLTACPSCGLSALGYVISSTVVASSIILSFYSQIAFTIASLAILTALLVYVIRTTNLSCKLDLTQPVERKGDLNPR